MDKGEITAFVETPTYLLSGPLRLAVQANSDDGSPVNLAAAEARVVAVRSRLANEGRRFFHLEDDRDQPGLRSTPFSIGDILHLVPRWEDPADLDTRRGHFELLFGILAEAGIHNESLLRLIDWAIEPLHHAWWSEWQLLARQGGVSWHGLTSFEVGLAHRHYEQIRSARISMLTPWLTGAFPTRNPTMFGLLHAGLPPVAGYVALRLAGGSVGNLVVVPGSEEEDIAKLLLAHRLLRFAGTDQASGNPKYVRTPSFIESMGRSYEERMKLPR
jgi:hypothetical protein